jgi:hypothetical protein
MGPHKSGPTQYPATNRDIVRIATSCDIPNSLMSSGMILDGAELAKVLDIYHCSVSWTTKEGGRICIRVENKKASGHCQIPSLQVRPILGQKVRKSGGKSTGMELTFGEAGSDSSN